MGTEEKDGGFCDTEFLEELHPPDNISKNNKIKKYHLIVYFTMKLLKNRVILKQVYQIYMERKILGLKKERLTYIDKNSKIKITVMV